MGDDGMSDLVKRLRDGCNLQQRDGERAADRIEQLERELVEVSADRDKWSSDAVNLSEYALKQQEELAAEMALADQYKDALSNIAVMGFSDDPAVVANIARYAVEMARKARGL